MARLLGAGVGGAALVGVLMVGWTLATGSTLADLWLAVVQFRVDASEVLEAGDRRGIEERARTLTWSALAVGLIPFVLVAGALAVWSRFRVSSLSYATGVLIAFEAFCVVAGGNFWSHYLMGLAPGLALAAGLWGRHLPVRVVAGCLVAAAVVSVPVNLAGHDGVDTAQEVGRYVGRAAAAGDTATVMYGKADAQWASGLDSPYPHLWSLPVRVLDPDLEQLTALLASDEGPTWIIQPFARHQWGLDPEGRIDGVMRGEYDLVWEGCGTLVWLREGVERELPEDLPACAG